MKIFLLEDEYALRISVIEFLEDIGFEVKGFERGDDFLDALYEESCDVILLDVKVPGINGFELLKELRESGNAIPAIFITSLTQVDDLAKGFELGCCDYIKKPFDLKELEVRLKNVLKRECFKAPSKTISFGNDLVFDLDRMELFKGSERVELTRQEQKILELLLKKMGQPVATQEFAQEVWGEYVEGTNIRVHINKLRKKLGKNVIKNIHGIGYKIDS